MTLTIYIHPRCSTCKKALKFLEQENVPYESVSIIEHPPSVNELKEMLFVYQGEIKKLFNTSGDEYRRLELKDRLPSMSADEALLLLSGNGMLIKRPFLVMPNGKGLAGFKEEEWRKAIKK